MVRLVRWGILLLACAANGANAQTYPGKPVRIVVGFPAGGSVDIVARLLGQKLGESMGQQFIVDNRAGAAGNIAAEHVAKAPPDGYTLLLSSASALASSVSVFKQIPFNPQRDFAPVILVVHQPNVLVLHPALPARTVKEFIALAKANPGKLNYASSGSGGSQHLLAEMFIMMTGVDIVQVPYKGGAPAMTDLLSGQVELMFQTVPTVIDFIKSGRLRALAVTSPRRAEMLPNVPTMQESGLKGFDFRGWMALVAPAATPRDVIAKLNAESQKALDGDLRKRFGDIGLEIGGGSPEQFAQFMRDEIDKYAKLVKASGMERQ